MKKYSPIVLLILLMSLSSMNAQMSHSKVIYTANHSFPTSAVLNGKNTLHFDSLRSIFIHNEYPITNTPKIGGHHDEINIGDEEGCSVFFDFQNRKTYTKKGGTYLSDHLEIIMETMDTIHWEIDIQKKQIGEYTCTLATTYYEGRNYEVWFTTQIPFSFGPFRLRGLPGLILEARSIDNEVHWEFVSFESQSKETVQLIPPTNGTLYTWEEFVKYKLDYKKKIESRSTGNKVVIVHDEDPDRYIEKEKFCIYKRYLHQKK